MKYKLVASLFILGFLIGRLTASEKSSVRTTSSNQSKTESVSKVQTQASTKKDSTTRQQTIVTKKSYSRNGKLKHSTTIVTKRGAHEISGHTTDSFDESRTDLTSSSHDTTSTSYNSNWIVGIYYPVTEVTLFKPWELSASVSYRFIGGLYASAIIDAKLQNPQVGAQFNF